MFLNDGYGARHVYVLGGRTVRGERQVVGLAERSQFEESGKAAAASNIGLHHIDSPRLRVRSSSLPYEFPDPPTRTAAFVKSDPNRKRIRCCRRLVRTASLGS